MLGAVGMGAFADYLRSGEQRDWATTTSPGERQRLAVARAIVQRPPLVRAPISTKFNTRLPYNLPQMCRIQVLLDEISSALDEPSESVLYGAVAAYCPTFLSLGTQCIHSHT